MHSKMQMETLMWKNYSQSRKRKKNTSTRFFRYFQKNVKNRIDLSFSFGCAAKKPSLEMNKRKELDRIRIESISFEHEHEYEDEHNK